MSKLAPARHRTTNWSSHTASLRRRDSLLIRLDKDMIWLAPHVGSPDRPAVHWEALIQVRLILKVLFKLSLRRTTAIVPNLLKLAGLG
jgi:hypothetical protein